MRPFHSAAVLLLACAPAALAANCGLTAWRTLHSEDVSSAISFDENTAKLQFGVRHEDCISASDLRIDLFQSTASCVASDACVLNPGGDCGECDQHVDGDSCEADSSCAWSELCNTDLPLDQVSNPGLFTISAPADADTSSCDFPGNCGGGDADWTCGQTPCLTVKSLFVVDMDTATLQNADTVYKSDFKMSDEGSPLDRLKLCLRAVAVGEDSDSAAMDVIFDETVVEVFINAITGFSSVTVEAERRGASSSTETIVAVGTTQAFQCAETDGVYAKDQTPVGQNGIMRVCIAGEAGATVQCEQVWLATADQAGGVGIRTVVSDGKAAFLTQISALVPMDLDGVSVMGCLVETLLQADYFVGNAPGAVAIDGSVALGFFGADTTSDGDGAGRRLAEADMSVFEVSVSLLGDAYGKEEEDAATQNQDDMQSASELAEAAAALAAAAAEVAAAEQLQKAAAAAVVARADKAEKAEAVAIAEKRQEALREQEAALAALQLKMAAEVETLAVVSQQGAVDVADGTTAGQFTADYGAAMCRAVGSHVQGDADCFFQVVSGGRRRLATTMTFKLGVVVDEAQAAAALATLEKREEVLASIGEEIGKDADLAAVEPRLEPPVDVAVSVAIASVAAAEVSANTEAAAVGQQLAAAEVALEAAGFAVAAAELKEGVARTVVEMHQRPSSVTTAPAPPAATSPPILLFAALGAGFVVLIAAAVVCVLRSTETRNQDVADKMPLSPRRTVELGNKRSPQLEATKKSPFSNLAQQMSPRAAKKTFVG